MRSAESSSVVRESFSRASERVESGFSGGSWVVSVILVCPEIQGLADHHDSKAGGLGDVSCPAREETWRFLRVDEPLFGRFCLFVVLSLESRLRVP